MNTVRKAWTEPELWQPESHQHQIIGKNVPSSASSEPGNRVDPKRIIILPLPLD